MYIKITGNEYTDKFLSEISVITDHSKLRPAEVKYDEHSRMLALSIVRFPILKSGVIRKYIYDKNRPISSTVVVRNVLECIVDDNTLQDMEEVTLLFGVSVKKNEVVLSSVEEYRGVTCYFIKCRISEIDIEIRDN